MARTAPLRSTRAIEMVRYALEACALLVLLACLVPPLLLQARRYEVAEALQFSLLAVVVPALFVAGAPWRQLRLVTTEHPTVDVDGFGAQMDGLRFVDRLARDRRRHLEPFRSVIVALVFAGIVIFWRTPLAVDALRRHPSLILAEAVSLTTSGALLWLELIESPPIQPRLSRPHRVAMAAIVMWVIWVLAYLVGLSHGSWYHGYDHSSATGLSVSADQQLTSGVIWLITGLAFVPVIFWNLIYWLKSEEDPDAEFHRLVRQERSRAVSVEREVPEH